MRRIPPVPSGITGVLAAYLGQIATQLNREAYISKFSGTDPNTSGVTGIPGDLLMNIGSASSATRLWIKKGSTASTSTISWVMVRIA